MLIAGRASLSRYGNRRMGYRSGFAVNPASAQGQPAQEGGFDAERVALVSLQPPQILADELKGNPMRLIVALWVVGQFDCNSPGRRLDAGFAVSGKHAILRAWRKPKRQLRKH